MEKQKLIPPKITLILNNQNHDYINRLSDEHHNTQNSEKFSYGSKVNDAISFQRLMTPEIRFEISEFIKARIHKLYDIRDEESFDNINYYNNLISHYCKLCDFLCDDPVDLSLKERSWLKTKNGHAIIPTDWILLESFGKLHEHESVLVVECKTNFDLNHKTHFYLASEIKDIQDITEELKKAIHDEIINVYSSFWLFKENELQNSISPENIDLSFNIFLVPFSEDETYFDHVTGRYNYPEGAYISLD